MLPSCNVCKGFNPDLPHTKSALEAYVSEINEDVWGLSITTNLKHLSDSIVDTGCGGCDLLYSALFVIADAGFFTKSEEISLTMIYDSDSHWQSDLPGSALFGLQISLQASTGSHGWKDEDEFEFFDVNAIEADRPPWRAAHALQSLPAQTSSSATLNWVKDRLAKCAQFHEECAIVDELPNLPTRVLDLGDLSETFSETIHLLESRDERGRYACLSHCWGKPGLTMMLQTTRATLAKHRRCIQIYELPQTFKDAIELTRNLRIRYRWIDSLCIVQDSPEDWSFEASRMCEVYKNAYLTIAATRAANSSAGLFGYVPPIYTGLKVAKRRGLDVYIRKTLPHEVLSRFDFKRDLKEFPLLGRGWVYQERMLSRRFLHFGPYEAYWEYATTTLCQCGDGFGTTTAGRMGEKALYTESLKSPRTHANSQWRLIVEAYSQLALSVRKDRLPALAGVTKQWIGPIKQDYVAGLWKTSLIGDLQWKVMKSDRREKPKSWCAPSWSWASVDSAVKYRRIPCLPLSDCAQVIDVKCVQKEFKGRTDDTGEVESGIAVLSGLLAAASLTFSDTGVQLRVGDERIKAGAGFGWDLGEESFCPDYVLRPEYVAGSSIFLLLLGVDDSEETQKGFALVLKSVQHANQVYERIGSCDYIRQYASASRTISFFEQMTPTIVTIH